jgi:uncharacterized protein
MAKIRVEVVYALPAAHDAVSVALPASASLRDALEASGVLGRHPEIDLERGSFGVFGKRRPLDSTLSNGDRVEVYRSLAVDPKERRRRRARRRRV